MPTSEARGTLYRGIKIHGNQVKGLIRQSGDTLQLLEDGTWRGTVIYICRWADVVRLAPTRNVSEHPDFSVLICNQCDVKRLKPGIICELTVSYRGFFGPEVDQTKEELVAGTSEAPIETHPNFVSVIGGTADAPLNDAIFDSDGKFTGFAATSRYAGVTSYLVASSVYRRTYPARGPESTDGVGTISSAPVGASGGRNWLLSAVTWTRDGGVYTVNKELLLSGPGGWDDTIYNV